MSPFVSENLLKKNIFILGELNVDLIMTGNDVTPEWNKEKLISSFDQVLGSSSAITACCLVGLGFNVYFVGVVGDDPFGHFCIEQLQAKGVNTSFVIKDATIRTGVTLSLSTNIDRALLTYMGSIPKLNEKYIPDTLFNQADHIHFGSYYLQEEMRKDWKRIFSKAKEFGISTSFDTGWDPNGEWHSADIIELLEFTDLFIPSEKELFEIMKVHDIDLIPNSLSKSRGLVAIKRGEKGSLLIDENEVVIKKEAFPVEPIDTTGAGDSFNAGLIAGFLSGKMGQDLLQLANACGSMATQRIGGASKVPTIEEVEFFIQCHASSKSGSI
jgi:sugar/nucleoside kinase (ribokinase family)